MKGSQLASRGSTPGFEPPTDLKVRWIGWILWPFMILAVVGFCALLLKGCITTVT